MELNNRNKLLQEVVAVNSRNNNISPTVNNEVTQTSIPVQTENEIRENVCIESIENNEKQESKKPNNQSNDKPTDSITKPISDTLKTNQTLIDKPIDSNSNHSQKTQGNNDPTPSINSSLDKSINNKKAEEKNHTVPILISVCVVLLLCCVVQFGQSFTMKKQYDELNESYNNLHNNYQKIYKVYLETNTMRTTYSKIDSFIGNQTGFNDFYSSSYVVLLHPGDSMIVYITWNQSRSVTLTPSYTDNCITLEASNFTRNMPLTITAVYEGSSFISIENSVNNEVIRILAIVIE